MNNLGLGLILKLLCALMQEHKLLSNLPKRDVFSIIEFQINNENCLIYAFNNSLIKNQEPNKDWESSNGFVSVIKMIQNQITYTFLIVITLLIKNSKKPINQDIYNYFNKQPLMTQNKNRTVHHVYKALKKIGQGNFGSVFLVQSENDLQKYIMKTLRVQQSQEVKQNILKEVKVMKSLSHQYVIKYYQSFLDQKKNVCIVMQYAEKGDLQKYLQECKNKNQPLKQQQVMEWLVQICLGLKYIHEKKIVHRDLKAENIFITKQNQLKIGDFGIAKVMSETFDLAKTKIGTPHVMAPQIWQNMHYNQKSDIWSLGCVLYKLMTLRNPFQASNTGSYIMKITSGKYSPILGNYCEELKNLVGQLLQISPQNRPSVQSILQKPFIKKNISQILTRTFDKYEINLIHQNSKKSFHKNTDSNHKISVNNSGNIRRSLSSLSNSTPSQQTLNKQNIKLIEFKQGYPILMQENKNLKKQLQKIRFEKEKFQQKTNQLFQQLEDPNKFTNQQILQKMKSHILYYLYP